LRHQTARIRERVKTTTKAIIEIGRDLIAVRQTLGHGQFILWVEAECGFVMRSAQKYMQVAKFVDDKCESGAHLAPATLYLVSAKNAPPEIVNEVTARAVNGTMISDADVVRMFKEFNHLKRQTANLSKVKRERADQPASAPAQDKEKIAKANALDLLWKLGRENSIFLIGRREHIVETLAYLQQEIDNPTPTPES
jgi:hypothetical protein